MRRFIQGGDRAQGILLPAQLDDYVTDENPVRVIDVFVDELDFAALGFEGMTPADTGRPAYHPADLLTLYISGYLNRIQSSRRLERGARRNIELMWLTGQLTPDFKTIANFRKDNGVGIRNGCRQFVLLCRNLDLFTQQLIAIDGSKFKAVNNRDRNFTKAKVQARLQQIEESIERYLSVRMRRCCWQPGRPFSDTTHCCDRTFCFWRPDCWCGRPRLPRKRWALAARSGALAGRGWPRGKSLRRALADAGD